MKYYSFINGLRAVAVIPVILFHYSTGVFPGGYAGVDVFFVISGFLITGLLADRLGRDDFSLLRFYESRARRLLPALFLTCGACLAFCWVYYMPEDFKLFGRSLLGAALFGTNFTFLEDVGYFMRPALDKPLLHTWSLAVEGQFYILYPLALPGLYKWSGGNRAKVTVGIFAAFAISLGLNLFFISRNPEATFYMLHTRAWELLAGALTFLYLQNMRMTKRVAEAAGLGGFVLLLYAFTCFNRSTPFPGGAAIIPVLGAVLLIWSNLQAQTMSGRILSSRPLVYVGLISYGLYLYHWPLLVFARYYLERGLTAPETAGALTLVTLLAVASYVFLEQPIREHRHVVSRRAVFAASIAGLMATGLAGVAGSKADGFPARFSGPVLQYVTDDKPPVENCRPLGDGKRDRSELCTLGDTSRKEADFILWGDSHADKIAPGLDAMARAHHRMGLMAWTPGCPPLLKLERPETDKYPCAASNERIFTLIRDRKIRTVILAARWDVVLQKEEGGVEAFRAPRGPRAILRAADGADFYAAEALRESYRNTIDALKPLNARVWVLKQVPPHLAYIPSALAKSEYLGRDTAALNRPLAAVLERRAPIDAAFDAVPEPFVTFLDPVNKFCPNGKTCIVAANGRSLYHDDTHLSVYGAMWAKDIWEPVFAR